MISQGVYTSKELSNNDYHGGDGVSSSQLKYLLDDPEVFYKMYVTKELPKPQSTAFDLGTYFHTAILEPDLLEVECAVYTGKIRSGKLWNNFQHQNEGKAIITSSEKVQADRMIDAVKSSKVAMDLLSEGEAEISCFVKLYVDYHDIYFCDKKDTWYVLGKEGWEPTQSHPKKSVEILAKSRADWANLKGGKYISDLKSTRGNVKDKKDIKGKISKYAYELSAAYYLDIFNAGMGDLKEGKAANDFIWIFASKDLGGCQCYRATQENLIIGRAKWKKAIINYANCVRNKWDFPEELVDLEPSFYEREWLKDPKDTELI